MRMVSTLFLIVSGALMSGPAWSNGKLIPSGRAIAEANCARCHSIDRTGASPFTPAPPFRVIARLYKASDLEEAFVEGIVVGHPAMPEFQMKGEEAAALAAFIDSLGQ
jgi:mono/diheme cytochrome c family protein